MCKKLYNDLKNESRLTEQHREAAETRRLLTALSGESDVGEVDRLLARFDQRCFNCEKPLLSEPGGENGFYLDHTLPVSWLWPLDLGPTILCRNCNGQKSDRWPSEFYGDVAKLRALAIRTGIPFRRLSGPPLFNPAAIQRFRDAADSIIERWVDHPGKLTALRTRIEAATGEDVFENASPASLRALGLTS